jgi:hypothetical protein
LILFATSLILISIYFLRHSIQFQRGNFNRDWISICFIVLLTALGPCFLYLSIFLPGRLDADVAGTNLGVVIQAGLLGITAFMVVLRKIISSQPNFIDSATVFFGVYVIWAGVNGFLLQQSWVGALSLTPLIVAIAFGSFTFEEIELGLWWSFTLISLGAAVVVIGFDGLGQCRADKCMIINKTLNFSGSQNSFSISIALLGLVLIYLQKSHLMRFQLLTIIGFLSILGGSRSAIYTLITVGIFLILPFWDNKSFVKRFLNSWVLVLSVVLSLFPVYSNVRDDAFTTRGILWRNAKTLISNNPIIGNGQSYWTHQFSSGGFVANYGTHNIWLDNLVAFGLVGFILFLCILASMLIRQNNSELKLLLAAIFILGTTESSFQLWKLSGGVPFFILVMLLSRFSDSKSQIVQRRGKHG